MKIYIVLLRGINVGGHRKIRMVELREMLEKLNFREVETYIQSGNIVLKSEESTNHEIAERIQKGIKDTFGFDVPVLVRTHKELKSIFDENPFTETSDIENKRIYFALLKETPHAEMIAAFRKEKYIAELFEVRSNCVYLNYLIGAGKAKLSNNLIERKLKVMATSRNYNTMVKLLAMSSGR